MLRFSKIMFKLGWSAIVGGGGAGGLGIRIQQTTYIFVSNTMARNCLSTVNESCSNELKPFLVQIQGIASNARRKLLNDSKKLDDFVQNALTRNCFDDCFST